MGFCELAEPQEAVLKDPPLDQRLKQDLKVLCGFEVLELKELLFEQTLFNVGISQVGPEGTIDSLPYNHSSFVFRNPTLVDGLALQIARMDPSLPKALGLKTLRKRKAEKIGAKSAYARVELLLAPPTFEIKESEPQDIDDFQIVQVQHDSSSSVPEGQRSHVKCLFSEAILSLPAPNVSNHFSKKEPTEASRTFGPHRPDFRPKQQDKMEVEMLKIAKDKVSKAVEEASTRADAAEKRAQDAEAALEKSIKENLRLSGVVDKFRASKEYEDKKAKFAVNAYDEGKRFSRSGVASHYPELNLDFLDETLGVTVAGVAKARANLENAS
ncbi:hypothetical protein COCNU_01G016220 [Cocos nucifera]|uniref:Uncharacterized protein n=1 Tax=Cocos nucifera TaxID=13894 RepID=A0A8K0MVI3_COCNU|nr:hypothetical protein COCNU_01G016220 [Cocos nucifera]